MHWQLLLPLLLLLSLFLLLLLCRVMRLQLVVRRAVQREAQQGVELVIEAQGLATVAHPNLARLQAVLPCHKQRRNLKIPQDCLPVSIASPTWVSSAICANWHL